MLLGESFQKRGLVPLEGHVFLRCDVVQMVMLIIQIFIKLLLIEQFCTTCVGIRVNLDFLRHCLGLPNKEVIEETESIHHAALFTSCVKCNPPLDEAHAIRIRGIGHHQPAKARMFARMHGRAINNSLTHRRCPDAVFG